MSNINEEFKSMVQELREGTQQYKTSFKEDLEAEMAGLEPIRWEQIAVAATTALILFGVGLLAFVG